MGTKRTSKSGPRVTPAMQQYHRFKKQYPECVLFFRMGDFYEMFDSDAVEMSKALGLTLTQRTEGVPMAGVPYHQCDNYVRRALKAGYRIAVCDQVQDPKDAKGVVARAVTRVYTPGTLVDEGLVEDGATSAVAAVMFHAAGEGAPAAAVADLTSGKFILFDLPEGAPPDALADELARFGVTEVVYPELADTKVPPRIERVARAIGASPSAGASWHFRPDEALEALKGHFAVATLTGFGIDDDDPAIGPAGALLRHLVRTQTPELDAELASDPSVRVPTPTLAHLRPPRRLERAGHLHLDQTTLRSLEVLTTLRAGETDGSLLSVFSQKASCRTPMGKRLLREWLCRPLADAGAIRARQRCVATLIEDRRTGDELATALGDVHDVSRIAARLALRRISPRDLVALGGSLALIDGLKEVIDDAPAFITQHDALGAVRDALAPLGMRIADECVDDPPGHLRDGSHRLFRDGVDAELDEARTLQSSSADWLASYQEQLITEHDLPNLKVGYNRVFGYYIELPAAQSKRAPATFTRRQTLKNAERYVTPELHEFESKVSTAEARALAREQAMFDELVGLAHERLTEINAFADVVAELDVLGAFATKAARQRWTRPEIVDEPVLRIVQGRHPVLDELLGTDFVPNDLDLGAGGGDAKEPEQAALALITGPNMAGKSTFIRQVALITLLAHTGSYVPADDAVVGLTDRIFTRVGADDALHRGQSTFMVEMTETARILHHATDRSLVILDEVGRGTSTLDGLSLAWAIAETLAGDDEHRGPRTLFATHYHELTQLAERMPGRARNLHVAVQEWGDEVVFLHRILVGSTDRSYGIHVAQLAGLPERTVQRASALLDSLAVHHGAPPPPASEPDNAPVRPVKGKDQLSLFDAARPHPVIEEIKQLDIDRMSPLDAFDALRALRKSAQDDA